MKIGHSRLWLGAKIKLRHYFFCFMGQPKKWRQIQKWRWPQKGRYPQKLDWWVLCGVIARQRYDWGFIFIQTSQQRNYFIVYKFYQQIEISNIWNYWLIILFCYSFSNHWIISQIIFLKIIIKFSNFVVVIKNHAQTVYYRIR